MGVAAPTCVDDKVVVVPCVRYDTIVDQAALAKVKTKTKTKTKQRREKETEKNQKQKRQRERNEAQGFDWYVFGECLWSLSGEQSPRRSDKQRDSDIVAFAPFLGW